MITDKMIAKFAARHPLSAGEEATLRALVTETKSVATDEVFIRQGVELTSSTVLIEGLVCRFKDSVEGKRQVSALHIAGDFIDLHSFTLKRLDHSIMALTPCVVAPVPHTKIREVVETHPRLAQLLWFSTTLDAALHREWALSLGGRDALERMAHLFCELYARLEIVGLVDADGYEFAITQQELGECLGLTPVHVNRTLKVLRERGFVVFRSNRVYIQDRRALETAAQFDGEYLYLRGSRI